MSDNGYDYRYKFSIDDTIIPSLCEEAVIGAFKIFQFEIRTDFVVAKIDGVNEIISSETFDAHVPAEFDEHVPAEFDEHVPAEESSTILYEFVHHRMKEYKMNWHEIEDFAEAANNFAKSQTAIDPKYRYLIPVVVRLEVCTVQQEGELLEDTMKRAMRAETLDRVSLSLPDAWPRPTSSVENVEALAAVEVCPVCLEELVYEIDLKKRVCPVCGSSPLVGRISSRWGRRWRSCKSVIRRILSKGFK